MSGLPADRDELMRLLKLEERSLADAEARYEPLKKKADTAWNAAARAGSAVIDKKRRVDELRAAVCKTLAPVSDDNPHRARREDAPAGNPDSHEWLGMDR